MKNLLLLLLLLPTLMWSQYHPMSIHSGLTELTLDKHLIKITDLMGKECLPETNKLLIYHYSDGTTQKTIKN
jgi:hypothetical protein